jgi:Tol biopolymer transport system component
MPPGNVNTPCLSGDETRVVFEQAEAATGNVDLWQAELATRQATRLTFDAAVDFYPVCSPARGDPQEVVFSSLRQGPPSLFRLPLGIPGSEKPALLSFAAKIASQWSPDGRWIVFSMLNPKTGWDVAVWPTAGGEPQTVVATAADERNGQISPDGRWLAYAARESSSLFQIYVQPFPSGAAKWQISRAGGNQPQWRRDGAELYYISPDSKLMAVAVKTGSSEPTFGEPQPLLAARLAGWEGRNHMSVQYAAARDGQRFLISTAADILTPITMMLNWPAKLARAR